MSPQSGIGASDELLDAFNAANRRPGLARLISIRIRMESLMLQNVIPPSEGRSEVEDFDLVQDLINPHTAPLPDDPDQETQSMYILFRLGALAEGKWVLISYVPETSKVRDKMLYASTRSTLSKQLGESNIVKTYFASSKDDLTRSAYQEFKDANFGSARPNLANLKPLMNDREKELEVIKSLQAMDYSFPNSLGGTQVRSSNLFGETSQGAVQGSGIGLNWTDESIEKMKAWAENVSHETQWVQFVIDSFTESISPHSSGSVDQLTFPTQHPCYTFCSLEFNHTTRNAFIYTCPSTSPIRSRLLYSSSASSVSSKPAQLFQVQIHKKIETSNPEELDLDYLKAEVGPHSNSIPVTGHPDAPAGQDGSINVSNRILLETKGQFSKPARPGRRA